MDLLRVVDREWLLFFNDLRTHIACLYAASWRVDIVS